MGEPRAERSRRALEIDHLMDDLGRRAASGGALAVAAQIVKLVIQLGTLAIMARLLTPADFGLVAMATAVTLFVGLFTDLGLSAATVQRREIDHETVSALFYINLATGIAIAALTIGAAPLAARGFGDPRVSDVVMALALQIPFVAAGAQHNALLRRGMRWAALNWNAIAAQSVGALVGIGLAWKTEAGYWALVAQTWVAALVALVLAWAACPWRPGSVGDWRRTRDAVAFGLHLTGFNFLNYINRQFDDVLIGWRWGATELGYYTRAYQLLLIPLTVVNNPVGSAVIPALSRLQDERGKWRLLYLDTLRPVTFVSVAIASVLVASAEPLVQILYGSEWKEAGRIFFFLAIGMFPAVVVNTTGWIYISSGRTNRMALWGGLKAILVLIAFLIGLPYGAKGVAIAYSSAECIGALPGIALATAGTAVSLRDVLRSCLPVQCAGIIAAVAGAAMQGFYPEANIVTTVVLCCVTAGLVYGALSLCILFLDPVLLTTRENFVKLVRGLPAHVGRDARA